MSVLQYSRLARLRRYCSVVPNVNNRTEFDNTCKRRFIYNQSFDGYSNCAGLYDLGPVGCSLKQNLINLWRKHFIINDSILEVDTTSLTPAEVFQVSGHTKKFTDPVITDLLTQEDFRADKYIESWCAKLVEEESDLYNENQLRELRQLSQNADGLTIDDYDKIISKYNIKSPKGNEFSKPKPRNLMFESSMGSSEAGKCYLRPELAQGILLNFKRLLDYNGGAMPFAAAAIGVAYRNEISPRNNLLRVREFPLAEIEHFTHPEHDVHQGIDSVLLIEVVHWSAECQTNDDPSTTITIGDALASGVIKSQTLAYYMARTQLFLAEVMDTKYIRFRQHKSNELAHYASDCWDCEILTSFGWIECVGIADRSCYDLTHHSNHTNIDFNAYERYPSPKQVETVVRDINKKVIGKEFRKDAPAVANYLREISDSDAIQLSDQIESDDEVSISIPTGQNFKITSEMFTTRKETKKQEGTTYTPKVIEPSFGIGRIVYAILENTYWVRPSDLAINEKRAVFSFTPIIAPYKCTILPLSASVTKEPWCQAIINNWRKEFSQYGMAYRVDSGSQSIGRRYSRSDEIGAPYNLTIDFDTPSTSQVTIRERDSTKQVYVKVSEATSIISDLCTAKLTWEEVFEKYPEKKIENTTEE
eukprot:TRINITY_DN10371_c0_g1_i1.p1 TRINITY_DN10371_c0_g1~~TRINITY_DN10371_c0_g1_i1.p1  ORF type:complete len:646 (+),score=91.04 TRINITY_DN10371_c0_g1_i1:357-2294(+)